MKAKIFIKIEVIQGAHKSPLYYLKTILFGQEFYLNKDKKITNKENAFKTHDYNLLKKYEPSN